MANYISIHKRFFGTASRPLSPFGWGMLVQPVFFCTHFLTGWSAAIPKIVLRKSSAAADFRYRMERTARRWLMARPLLAGSSGKDLMSNRRPTYSRDLLT